MKRYIHALALALVLVGTVAMLTHNVRGESLIEVLDEGQYEPGMCYQVRAWTSGNVQIGQILTVLEQFSTYYNSETESWQIPNEDMGITPAEALTYHHYTVSAYGQGQC